MEFQSTKDHRHVFPYELACSQRLGRTTLYTDHLTRAGGSREEVTRTSMSPYCVGRAPVSRPSTRTGRAQTCARRLQSSYFKVANNKVINLVSPRLVNTHP